MSKDNSKTRARDIVNGFLIELNAEKDFFNLDPYILNSRTDIKNIFYNLVWCLDQEQSQNPYEMSNLAYLRRVKSSILVLYPDIETPKTEKGDVLQ